MGFPSESAVKNPPAMQVDQDKRHRFNPWVRKISWRRKWQPTPVLLPGEFQGTEEPGGLQSMGSHRVRLNRGIECKLKHYINDP